MAMIQCSECGKEISDKAKKCFHCGKILIEEQPEVIKCSECGEVLTLTDTECPNCGCPLNITKQIISDAKKKHSKKIITTIIICFVIIIVLAVSIGLIKYSNTPANAAVKLIKKDFGKNIIVESIYYNSEINGCIIKFSLDGEDNTATVHLDDKTVGYQSVLDELSEKSDRAVNDEEKKLCRTNCRLYGIIRYILGI